jgi:hypothetical protein
MIMSSNPSRQFEIFQHDIREHVLKTLPYDPALKPDLEAMTTADLLILYLNWTNRLVPAVRRLVHESRSFLANSLTAAHQSDVRQLIEKIKSGADLKPHLSRRIKVGYERSSGGSYGKRRDLDLMLADWQVHHLHLSQIVESDGFVKRDGPVLFASFQREDVYVIDIFGHNDWTRDKIAHILIDDFPQCGFVHEVKNILGVTHQPNEGERGTLRGGGVSSPFIEYKGKFYMIGLGGITSAGTAVSATRLAQYILGSLKNIADYVERNPAYVSQVLSQNGIRPTQVPDLHVFFNQDHDYGWCERNTGAIMPWPR